MCVCVCVCVCVCGFVVSATHLIYFGDLLRCAHKRIVTIMKLYIARNNIQAELIRFRKTLATLLPFGNLKCTWKYTFATDVLIAIRDESPLFYRAPGTPDVSEHSHFGTYIGTSTIWDCTTALFQVPMYRQFARKVGTSTNSAIIRYDLPRLKLSSWTRDRE